MDAGSQPLGTGTTFFNMMDFVKPKSEQAPTPVQSPAPQQPAQTPAQQQPAMPSIMSYSDWLKDNPITQPRQIRRGHDNGNNDFWRRTQNARSQSRDRYMMEMIRQLGGLPDDANMGQRRW